MKYIFKLRHKKTGLFLEHDFNCLLGKNGREWKTQNAAINFLNNRQILTWTPFNKIPSDIRDFAKENLGGRRVINGDFIKKYFEVVKFELVEVEILTLES